MENQLNQTKTLFSHFQNLPFRPGQEEAIQFILDSTKPISVICAPTGSGKSLIGMIVGEKIRDNDAFLYCVSSKQLQGQLEREFPEVMWMMGRSNFLCNRYPQLNADMCSHSEYYPCPHKKTDCAYESHKRRVLAHPRQILNYHYFLTEANYVGQFSDYPILIADEADLVESLLTDFISLPISRRVLDKLSLDPPRYKTACSNGVAEWLTWAKKLCSQVDEWLITLVEGRGKTVDENLLKEEQMLKSLHQRLVTFTDHVDESWLLDILSRNGTPFSWNFSPTWLTEPLTRLHFLSHTDRVVMMSATFPPVHILAKMLGLPPGDIEVMELPSIFPIENRRVYLNPVADMSYKTIDEGIPDMKDEVERILELHPHEKGIVHTVSWKLNEAIMRIDNSRLITHTPKNKQEMFKYYLEAKKPVVFVSPSSARGIDLPDDLCRFVILPKAPFQSLGDKRVNARVYSGHLGGWWYRSLCAQEIVQACGRAVRHDKDHAVTYLLDSQICNMVTDNQHLFPRYWIEAVDVL